MLMLAIAALTKVAQSKGTATQAIKTVIVTALDDVDDGQCDEVHCSLREAIKATNADSAPNQITFQPELFTLTTQQIVPKAVAQVITLERQLPTISSDLEIIGPGARLLTLKMKLPPTPLPAESPPPEGRQTARRQSWPFFVFTSGSQVARRAIQPATPREAPQPPSIPAVYLTGLTFVGGSGYQGGALVFHDCAVRLESLVFSSNGGGRGAGAIMLDGGTMAVEACTFKENRAAYGGAIWNNLGQLTITRSTFQGNRADTLQDEGGYGGAIYNNPESTTFVNSSTFYANYSGGYGGVLYNNRRGTVRFSSSTLSNNSTGVSGGAIYNNGQLAVEECTLTLNQSASSGGALCADKGRIIVRDSIIAGNLSNDQFHDLFGNIVSGGHNLIGIVDGSPSFIGQDSKRTDAVDQPIADNYGFSMAPLDAGLELLNDNGGPTWTHALRPDSPARDCGQTQLPSDQRGRKRPYDDPATPNGTDSDGSDIGAFETQADA